MTLFELSELTNRCQKLRVYADDESGTLLFSGTASLLQAYHVPYITTCVGHRIVKHAYTFEQFPNTMIVTVK